MGTTGQVRVSLAGCPTANDGKYISEKIYSELNDGKKLGELLDIELVNDSAHRRVLLLNLLDGVIRGHLEVSSLLKVLPDLAFKPEDAVCARELCDVVWITWLMQDICHPGDTEGAGESAVDASEVLVNVTNKLMESQYIDRRTIMEVSEGEFLESMGLISSYKDGWRKREIRANTRNVYAQRKFNLLREEMEGYSKVLTLLNQAGAAKLCDATLNNKLAEINSIIGYFDLDPNRVCSLMLDAFAASPDNGTFIHLIRNFGNTRLVEMAGFRLASGQGLHPGVYKSIAKLTKEGMIDLEDLIGKFSPNEGEYKKAWCERAKLLKDSVQKIGIISLSSSQADKGSGEEGKVDQPLRKAGQTAQNIAIDTAPFRRKLTGEDGSMTDQRMHFLAELLNCGAWDQAILFAKHLKCLGIEDVASFECVGKALCRIVYQELGGNLEKQPVDQKIVPTARATVALGLIQCHLHHNLLALSRVIKFSEALFAHGQAEEAIQLMIVNILPAVNLVPANAALCHQLWQVLTQLPCESRFKIYSGFTNHVQDSSLSLASEKLAETEVRRILRRVTAPTNKREAKQAMRPISRLLAKISHANPLVVCKQLLRQVMGMPGMVLSIAESLKYLSPLTFDVMTFMILKQLSCGKRKLKEDGVNVEEWFQWLASFTGLICRNQSGIEVTALLQYIVNQLKTTESMDLLVLREIISTMTKISPAADVSNQQLDTLAGSDDLIQFVVGYEDSREHAGKRETTRATNRLLNALRKGSETNKLLLPLLLLLAQQRKLIALHPPSRHLKLASEMVDKCQEVTMQYIEFLQKSLSYDEYSSILPSIEDLAVEYKIDLEIVLQIYRPIIKQMDLELDHKVKVEEEGEISAGNEEALPHDTMEDGEVVVKKSFASTWDEVGEKMKILAPEGQFKGISWQLFVSFWTLTLPDLRVPDSRYEVTLKQLQTSIKNIHEEISSSKKDVQRGGGHWGHGGGPPQGMVDVSVLRGELSKMEGLATLLPKDLKSQKEKEAQYRALLENLCTKWVKDVDPECQAAAAKEFVQFCILPRLFLSPADALYCVEFLHRIHKLGPPGLRLLSIVDRLFRDLGYMVRCCTPKESTNLGIFFSDLMGMVAKWRQKKVYAIDCAQSEAFKSYKKKGILEPVSFEEFVKLSANWHKTLTLNVFKSCIVSKDYMQMKNVLLVLNRMVRIYPATKEDAQELLDTLKPISEDDPREDLKTLARMYCTGLEMSMRDRKMTATRHEYAGLPPPKRKAVDRLKVDVGTTGGSTSKSVDKRSPEVSNKIPDFQAQDRIGKDAARRDQQEQFKHDRSPRDGKEKVEKKESEKDREQKAVAGSKMDGRDNLKRKAGEEVRSSNWDRSQDRAGAKRARDRYSDEKEMLSKSGSKRETGRSHEEDKHAMDRRENRDGRLRGHSTIVTVVSERRRSYGTSTDFQVDSRKQKQEKEEERTNQTSRLASQRPQKEDRDSRRTGARDADKHQDPGMRSHKSARNAEPNRDESQRTRDQYSRRKHKRDEQGSNDNKSKRSKHDEAYADKNSTGRGQPTEKIYKSSKNDEPPSRVRNRLKDPSGIVSAALRNSREEGERHSKANRPSRNRNRY
eukprot:jgi/Picsp_1/6237/NSC_03591-R1_tho complex subunit 2